MSSNDSVPSDSDSLRGPANSGPVDPWWIMPAFPYAPLEDEGSGRRGHGPGTQDLEGSAASATGYRLNPFKLVLYYVLNLVGFGVPYLLGRWYCQWKVFLKCSPAPLRTATVLLIKDEEENYFTCRVVTEAVAFLPDEFSQRDGGERASPKARLFSPFTSEPIFRHFTFRYEKFVWDDGLVGFRKLDGLEGQTSAQLLTDFQGLSHSKRIQLKTVYGPNLIDVEVKGYGRLLVGEVLNPFYVFQLFSVILWSFDDYYYYASCVVIISVVSIIISLHETKKQTEMLRSMAEGGGDFLVTVKRAGGDEEEICSRDLVPGDVLLIPPEGCTMPCDAVVIHGTCIVNESMLTGESIPVRKTALLSSNDVFNCDVFKRHVVFSGTHVIQTRFYAGNKVSCIVVRTGFSTQKGSLIRSMIFPKEVGLDFYRDAMRFVGILFAVAFLGMGYSISLYLRRGSSWDFIVVRVLDIVTIVVPPALPAAMTVGTVYAQNRLKAKKIYCISPPKINYCGKLKLICFDKTGTLTEDGLDLWCVVPVQEGQGGTPSEFLDSVVEPSTLPLTSPLLRCMASCHSLTHIGGNLVGDPMDLKMFEGTGWELDEPLNNEEDDTRRFDLLTPSVVKKGDVEIGIMREFEFTPQLQRMSVVVKPLDSRYMTLFCKGAPEKVSPLCRNVPENYDLMLDSFTVKGYRVLTLAWRPIEGLHWHQVQRVKREEVETDMIFAGFLVMQNSLKPATIPVIRELTAGDVRSVMVTGDNMLTALSVARECGMIPACDKVVIVNATDDGRLEYTLAAQHYEPDGATTEEEDLVVDSGNHTKSENSPDSRTTLVGPEDGHEVAIRRRSSLLSNDDEVRIDMERLVPISAETFQQALTVDLGSNYHFVVTGRTWNILLQQHSSTTIDRILAKGTVYARMSPECKRQLVESLQGLGYVVGMCGDGANDCAALKAAHVGISLSEAEASVAAPFTSKVPDVSCVPHVIREGRCALVTSFGMFKYMALYSMVQFMTVLILATNFTKLSDKHYLFIDLGITTTIAVVMGRTEPYPKIVPKQPMGSLISVQNISSILAQIVLAAVIQLTALLYLEAQPWFTPAAPTTGDQLLTMCWETTTLFTVSAYQYLILGIVFSKGPPYRKHSYTNVLFVIAFVILTSLTILITVYPVGFLADFLSLMPVTEETASFRYMLLLFPLVNIMAALCIEMVLSNSGAFQRFLRRLGYKRNKHKYQVVLDELAKDKAWPPVKSS